MRGLLAHARAHAQEAHGGWQLPSKYNDTVAELARALDDMRVRVAALVERAECDAERARASAAHAAELEARVAALERSLAGAADAAPPPPQVVLDADVDDDDDDADGPLAAVAKALVANAAVASDERAEKKRAPKRAAKRRRCARPAVSPPKRRRGEVDAELVALAEDIARLVDRAARTDDATPTLTTRITMPDGATVDGVYDVTPAGKLQARDAPAHRGALDADEAFRELLAAHGVFDEAGVSALAAASMLTLDAPPDDDDDDDDEMPPAARVAVAVDDIEDAGDFPPRVEPIDDDENEEEESRAVPAARRVEPIDDDRDDELERELESVDAVLARIAADKAAIERRLA